MLDKRLFLIPLTALLLAGCVEDDESVEPSPNPNDAEAAGFQAKFNPAGGIAPFPNDIFIDVSADSTGALGTLAPPGVYDPVSADDPNADFGDPLQAMSALGGWSRNASLKATFNDSVDASTLAANVFVVNTATLTPLVPGVDYSIGLSPAQDSAQSTIQITPLHPLEPGTTYVVIVTSGVKSAVGASAEASPDYQAIKDAFESGATLSNPTLEAIKDAYAPLLTAATAAPPAGFGIPLESIAVTWTVTTQATGAVFAKVVAKASAADRSGSAGILPLFKAPPSAGDPNGEIFTSKELIEGDGPNNPALIGNADVYAGAIELPYYSSVSNPLTGFWTGANASFLTAFNPTPVVNTTIKVPLLLTIPNSKGGPFGTGCPGIAGVVIFLHGITQDRTNVLAVSETFAKACHAVIAIDQTLHGITDTSSPLYASESNPLYAGLANVGFTPTGITEATFDLDVVNNATGAPGGDGEIDASGTHFINLASLLTSRDNLRQSVSNQIYLAETIPDMNYDAVFELPPGGLPVDKDFATLPIKFVGHSLGGIVGGTFLGVYNDDASNSVDVVGVGPATLGMAGGNISQLLLNSPTIGAQVKAGLAAKGLAEGTQLFYNFFRNAQTVIDAGDPINYAATANANHPIHMIEVVGGSGSAPDQVVPNSSTEALANAMGVSCVDGTTVGTDVDGLVKFTAGDHGSLLDPTASAAATVEMQTEMAIFIGGNPLIPAGPGDAIVISDNTVIATCPTP